MAGGRRGPAEGEKRNARGLQTEVRAILDNWQRHKTSIFDNRTWSGGASNAAKGKLESHIQKLESLDKQLTIAIDFYNNAYNTVVGAKNEVIGISEDAQDQIDDMLNEDTDDVAGRQAQIQGIVNKAFAELGRRDEQQWCVEPRRPIEGRANPGGLNDWCTRRRISCRQPDAYPRPGATQSPRRLHRTPTPSLKPATPRSHARTPRNTNPKNADLTTWRPPHLPLPDPRSPRNTHREEHYPHTPGDRHRPISPRAPHNPHPPPHLQPHPQPQRPAPHPRRAFRPAPPVAHLDPAAQAR